MHIVARFRHVGFRWGFRRGVQRISCIGYHGDFVKHFAMMCLRNATRQATECVLCRQ